MARATTPVMSPGYVRYHPLVLAAQLERTGWDGSLVAGVDLVSPWPAQIRAALAGRLRLGDKETYWLDWPAEYRGGEAISYHEPTEADVAAWPYALAAVSLQFTVPSAGLPDSPATSAALLGAGQQAVAVVVAELNRITGLVLSAILGPTSPVAGRPR